MEGRITIEEIPAREADKFFEQHIRYLTEDGIITDKEDIDYFYGDEYRGIILDHMQREDDRYHLVWFRSGGERIGAASYCTYLSEGGKCFILDLWVFPQFRGSGTGHRCFEALEEHTKREGALWYEINSEKEDSVRFWKSLSFTENGEDEYGMPLFIKKY
ncbi:MAG: GNAT family N-acetyltransferase [Oscillospiraceae bacterium]|nr:GNAT family N-acetyltransferase [Oscillospiraceae bacterium]